MATIAGLQQPDLAGGLTARQQQQIQEQRSCAEPLLPALETLPGAQGAAALGSASTLLLP